jgi:branched-chain amino acid transport system ATP-binding protein
VKIKYASTACVLDTGRVVLSGSASDLHDFYPGKH